MRDELAKLIQERTGLDESMALQVADLSLDFVKQKLPPSVAPILDGQMPDLGNLGGMFGGLLGKREG